MADQNKSSRGAQNSQVDDLDASSVLTELERIGARAGRQSVKRAELENRMNTDRKALNSLMDQAKQNPGFADSPFYQEQVGGLRGNINNLKNKMNSMDVGARTRAESEASTYIGRQYSSSAINSQVARAGSSEEIQNRAFAMSGMSAETMNGRAEEIHAQIRNRERQAQGLVKGMFTNSGMVNGSNSLPLQTIMSGTEAQKDFRELASINAAKAIQRTNGNDPNTKLRNLADMGTRANEILSAESMAQEVRSGSVKLQGGQTVANDQVGKEIVNQSKLLAEALAKLTSGAETSAEKLGEFRQEAETSAANLEKLQKAEAAGAGGGDGGRGAKMSYYSGAAGAFNALGSGAREVFVNQRMGQVNNVAGFADIANQQYSQYQKARGGDIASQLALGQWDDSSNFGLEMSRGTKIAQGAQIAGGGLQVAAGSLQVGEGMKNSATLGFMNNGVAQNLSEGGQNVIQGAVTMGVTGMDMQRGVSSGASQIAGVNAQNNARQAINAIGASQAQGLRNFYTDLDVAGQDLGSSASSFINTSTSKENLNDMADARLSPEQYAKLSKQGAQGMGSTFDNQQVFTARAMERGGFGDANTNMSRMASLSAAGGNNPSASLQGTLEAAFSKSLDSSKALNMMVENTAAMAAGTAAAASGIDTTGATATMLMAGTNGNMGNKEAALQQAISAAQLTAGITTNASATFTGMVNTAGISQATGLSGDEAIVAQGLTIQEYKAMQQAGPDKASEFYRNQGINVSSNKADDFTSSMLRQKQLQIIRDKGIALGTNASAVLDRVNAGTETEADNLALGKGASLSGYKGGAAQMKREILGVTAQNSAEGVAKAADASSGGGPNDMKKQMDDLRTSGFKQLTEAAATASTNLEKFGGALKVFTDLTQKFEKGGMNNEEQYSGAAAKMATDFSTSTGMFKDSVGQFDAAVNKLAKNVGLNSNGTPVNPDFVNNILDKAKAR